MKSMCIHRIHLSRQFLEEFLLVQPVLEGLTSVDKYDRHLIGELAAQKIVGFNIDFPPAETAPALQLRELLLDDFAKVTSLAGIHDHFADEGHSRGV